MPPARWTARLQLRYRCGPGGQTLAHDRHEGPLRVLRPLHPEGPRVCHHVLVHPPGGIVGGDELDIDVALEAHTHVLITTPGATRFYRSAGPRATQHARITLAQGARLEWLPLESIAYSGCEAHNSLCAELAAGAEMIGWDVLALGLPEAGQAYSAGRYTQHLELSGAWLERGLIAADDARLLDAAPGLAGHRVMATLWLATGSPMPDARRDTMLHAARALSGSHALARTSGSTSPHPRVLVLRALAHRVEPAMTLLAAVRDAWREQAWGMPACRPRVWST